MSRTLSVRIQHSNSLTLSSSLGALAALADRLLVSCFRVVAAAVLLRLGADAVRAGVDLKVKLLNFRGQRLKLTIWYCIQSQRRVAQHVWTDLTG
jgi:hypothetical protein